MSDNDTIGKLFLKRISNSKNHDAIGWFKEEKLKLINFKAYRDIIERLSLALISKGINPGDKISILAHTCKEWHFCDLAILCSRAVTVPIYPNYLEEDVEFIYNHSESKMLIVENDIQLKKIQSLSSKLKELELIITLKPIEQSLIDEASKKFECIYYKDFHNLGIKEVKDNPGLFEKNINEQNGDEIASIIYTSGTTGEPKGAVILHKAFAQMLKNTLKAVHGGFNHHDRTLTFLPLSHVLGRADSMLPIIFGWQMVFAQSLDTVVDDIAAAKPTIMLAVPRIFEKIYAKIFEKIDEGSFLGHKIFNWATYASNNYFEKLEKDISPSSFEVIQRHLAYKLVFSKIYEKFGGRIRYFVSGGAPLSEKIIKFLRNANLTILEGYGLTETIAPCCLNPLSKQIPGTVGLPTGEVQIDFASDGEILIKSKALFSKYYKNDELTNTSFKNGWFHTGDIGEFTKEGYLKITDRKKDIIITAGGKNVAPQKIENYAKLKRHISNFVVIGEQKKYLTAVVGIEKEKFLGMLEEFDLPLDCSVKQIAAHAKANKIIESEIDQLNKKLARFETIKKFYIAPEEFSVEVGHVTPSLKVKRKFINDRYKEQIDAMYH